MNNEWLILVGGVVLILGLQVWATARVWTSGWFVRAQKAAQSSLIWLLPIIGVVFVLVAHHEIAQEDVVRNNTNTRQIV